MAKYQRRLRVSDGKRRQVKPRVFSADLAIFTGTFKQHQRRYDKRGKNGRKSGDKSAFPDYIRECRTIAGRKCNGNRGNTITVAREVPVFYDNAEGGFDSRYTGRKNAQYSSDIGSTLASGIYALYYHAPVPYADGKSLYIGGENPPLRIGAFDEDAYIQLEIALERKAEISFVYANGDGTISMYNTVSWPLSTAAFSVNGVVKQTFSAESGMLLWRRVSFSLNPGGKNVLRWQK
jgi:hypothetical protein